MGPRGIPGGLSSTGLGDTVLQYLNVSTIAVENSLQYVGESLSQLMLTQQNVNRNMVDHLNLTAEAQDVQTHVLTKLVKNTRQQEFNKLFNTIPIYDGEDPDKFEPWLTQLENERFRNPSSLTHYGQDGWYPRRDPMTRLVALGCGADTQS